MAYTIPEIILWAKLSQPYARIGEAKRFANGDTAADVDLDMKLYNTRRDVEYEYAQDSDSENLYAMGNYLLTLCGRYLFQAQSATVGGGTVTPIVPSDAPDPYIFEVDNSTTLFTTGSSSAILPASWSGYNVLLFRGTILQSTVNTGGTYYSWDSSTRTLVLLPSGVSGQATLGELFQIYPSL